LGISLVAIPGLRASASLRALGSWAKPGCGRAREARARAGEIATTQSADLAQKLLRDLSALGVVVLERLLSRLDQRPPDAANTKRGDASRPECGMKPAMTAHVELSGFRYIG
jgi:hypothetical protein